MDLGKPSDAVVCHRADSHSHYLQYYQDIFTQPGPTRYPGVYKAEPYFGVQLPDRVRSVSRTCWRSSRALAIERGMRCPGTIPEITIDNRHKADYDIRQMFPRH
jgi:hypothetical protein